MNYKEFLLKIKNTKYMVEDGESSTQNPPANVQADIDTTPTKMMVPIVRRKKKNAKSKK